MGLFVWDNGELRISCFEVGKSMEDMAAILVNDFQSDNIPIISVITEILT
jgi:hypothetical protein